MSKFRLSVDDSQGRARITLIDNRTNETVGVANISWPDYKDLLRDATHAVLRTIRASLKTALGTRIWQDANTIAAQEGTGDPEGEKAKRLLEDFGWNMKKIDTYADELARVTTQSLTNFVPEHGWCAP